MAQLFIVPAEDYEVLRKYQVTTRGESVILVPEPVIDTPDFPKEAVAKLRELDGKTVDYDFGGEPDVYMDIVTDRYHYALESLAPDPAYAEYGEEAK